MEKKSADYILTKEMSSIKFLGHDGMVVHESKCDEELEIVIGADTYKISRTGTKVIVESVTEDTTVTWTDADRVPLGHIKAIHAADSPIRVTGNITLSGNGCLFKF